MADHFIFEKFWHNFRDLQISWKSYKISYITFSRSKTFFSRKLMFKKSFGDNLKGFGAIFERKVFKMQWNKTLEHSFWINLYFKRTFYSKIGHFFGKGFECSKKSEQRLFIQKWEEKGVAKKFPIIKKRHKVQKQSILA